jgi:hypothetical protein
LLPGLGCCYLDIRAEKPEVIQLISDWFFMSQQVRISNYPKLLMSKAMVVNIRGKGSVKRDQVCGGRRTKVNRLMGYRNAHDAQMPLTNGLNYIDNLIGGGGKGD